MVVLSHAHVVTRKSPTCGGANKAFSMDGVMCFQQSLFLSGTDTTRRCSLQ